MSKKPLEIDMISSTQVRDSQGELLDLAGADIDKINYFNADHGQGFFNRLGYIVEAKKIFKAEDCTNERHQYYWDKVKTPYLYVRGYLYDNDDHPNARACAAILRNIHKNDLPYKLRASVEGGTIARGVKDPSVLARTKIVGVALTFVPANHTTLVEPLNIEKSESTWEKDKYLIESMSHLVKHDPPSFRQIERQATADSITDKLNQISAIADQLGIPLNTLVPSAPALIKGAIEAKIASKVKTIHELSKAVVEDLGVAKSNYGPKDMGLYNPTDNIPRKANRTGEVREGTGQNQAVHEYTSATMGTAKQQADAEAKKTKKLNAKQPVKVFSPEEKARLQAEYDAKLKKVSESPNDPAPKYAHTLGSGLFVYTSPAFS